MTEIRVSAEDIEALGSELHAMADSLGQVAFAAADDAWALGPGLSAPLLREVVTDFEHDRLALARVLRRLGDLAREAGGAYAQVEDGLAGGLVCGADGRPDAAPGGAWTGGGLW